MVHLDIGITTQCRFDSHVLFNNILLGTQIVVYVFIGPLLMMLIVQVLAHLIFSLPFAVVFFMTMIPTSIIYTELYSFLFFYIQNPVLYRFYYTTFSLYFISETLSATTNCSCSSK